MYEQHSTLHLHTSTVIDDPIYYLIERNPGRGAPTLVSGTWTVSCETEELLNFEARMAAAQKAGYGAILLKNQLRDLTKNPVDGFSVGLEDDDIYKWRVMMEGPENTPFEGGYFPARLSFPKEYPNKPPVMVFLTPGFFHPNVYKDGKVCISILHEAKEDKFNKQELMEEKWRPILGVEAVLVSVLSMLGDPNLDSPANVDAAVMLKKDPKAYRKEILKLVRKSQDREVKSASLGMVCAKRVLLSTGLLSPKASRDLAEMTFVATAKLSFSPPDVYLYHAFSTCY
eukprot:g17983.t1